MRFNRTNRVIVISMLVFFVMAMTIASVSAVPDSGWRASGLGIQNVTVSDNIGKATTGSGFNHGQGSGTNPALAPVNKPNSASFAIKNLAPVTNSSTVSGVNPKPLRSVNPKPVIKPNHGFGSNPSSAPGIQQPINRPTNAEYQQMHNQYNQ